MSQTGAINSGAINALSFPGAEAGLSLVQLIGEVSVTCTITNVYRLLNVGATTAPRAASGGVNLALRSAVGVAVTGVATAQAGIMLKSPRSASTQGAAASTSALISRRLSVLALTSCSAATAPSVARSRIILGATTAPSAAALVESRKKTYTAASTAARAAHAVTAWRKLVLGAKAVGSANFSISIIRRQRVGATTVAAATAMPSQTKRRLPLAAGTVSTITHSVTPYRGLQQRAVVAASALASNIVAGTKITVSASAQAKAASTVAEFLEIKRFLAGGTTAAANGSVATTGRIVTGASTVASFASYIVATDLNITQPAPLDRQMAVPLDDRRMEVDAS